MLIDCIYLYDIKLPIYICLLYVSIYLYVFVYCITKRHRYAKVLRPFVILRIVGPRIFESKFRNHCAKKIVGAPRKPTSFM